MDSSPTRWLLSYRSRILGCATLLALVIDLSVAVAFDPVTEIKFVDRKKDRFAVENMLRAGTEIPIRDQDKFNLYFQEYVLPPIADPDADLPSVRNEIKRNFRTGTKGQPYGQLNEIVRDYMKFVIRKVADPACRVNAILVLGDLNEYEGEGARLSRPLPAGLDDLIAYLKMPKLPDYMRVAALVGVQRHAVMSYQYPLEQNSQEEISAMMFDLLTQKQVPPGRDPSAHFYLRRTAAEILGLIGNPGKNGEIVATVIATMNEKDTPLSMRLGLCNVLGMFKYSKDAKVDYKAAGVAVGRTLLDASQQELNRAELLSEQKQVLVDPDRRRLAYIYRQAWLALFGDRRIKRTGLVAAATEAQRPEAETLSKFFTVVSKTLSDLDDSEAIVDGSDFGEKLAAIRELLLIKETAQPDETAPGKLPADVPAAKKVAAGVKPRKAASEPANR